MIGKSVTDGKTAINVSEQPGGNCGNWHLTGV
jgi:hypothetical protein